MWFGNLGTRANNQTKNAENIKQKRRRRRRTYILYCHTDRRISFFFHRIEDGVGTAPPAGEEIRFSCTAIFFGTRRGEKAKVPLKWGWRRRIAIVAE